MTSEEVLIECIREGNLEYLKTLSCDYDINGKIKCEKLRAKRKYTGGQGNLEISQPTLIMFTILCEQDQILAWILQAFNDRIDWKQCDETSGCGLHLAVFSNDWHCLWELLQCKGIRDVINMPMIDHNCSSFPLHCAVSYGNIANAFLLLDYIVSDNQLLSTIIDQCDGSGYTVLWKAIRMHDVQMAELLLTCCSSSPAMVEYLQLEIKNEPWKGPDELDPRKKIIALLQYTNKRELRSVARELSSYNRNLKEVLFRKKLISEDIPYLVCRLTRGTDLYDAILENACKSGDASHSIVTCVGSLIQCEVRLAGATSDHSECKHIEGPLEIVSLVGTIAQKSCHIHISVSDSEGHVFGGHLMRGSIVDTTAEIVLMNLKPYIHLKREFDPNTGFNELKV